MAKKIVIVRWPLQLTSSAIIHNKLTYIDKPDQVTLKLRINCFPKWNVRYVRIEY